MYHNNALRVGLSKPNFLYGISRCLFSFYFICMLFPLSLSLYYISYRYYSAPRSPAIHLLIDRIGKYLSPLFVCVCVCQSLAMQCISILHSPPSSVRQLSILLIRATSRSDARRTSSINHGVCRVFWSGLVFENNLCFVHEHWLTN